eukprot:g18452.t1
MDEFQQPGVRGWGMSCRGCSESFSVSAPEDANNGGKSCVGKTVLTDTKAVCAGHCGKSSSDHRLYDMMGIGNEIHFFCGDCKYKLRAGVLGGVQEYVEAERIKRENGGRDVDTPRSCFFALQLLRDSMFDGSALPDSTSLPLDRLAMTSPTALPSSAPALTWGMSLASLRRSRVLAHKTLLLCGQTLSSPNKLV